MAQLLSAVLGYLVPGYGYLGGHVAGSAPVNPQISIAVSDNLDFQDFGDWNPYTAHSDQFELSDSVQVDFLIYTEPLSVVLEDQFLLGEHQLIIQYRDTNEQVDIYEQFLLTDPPEVGPGVPAGADGSDSLNLTDAVTVAVEGESEAFDTLQGFWLDGVQVSLDQAFTFSDSISLSDAVNVDLIIVGITQSLSDVLALSDAIQLFIIVQRELADRLVLSDETQLTLTHAVEVADLLSLSDAITLAEDSIFSFNDQLSLSDAVEAILSQPLTVSVSDVLSLSDTVGVIRGGNDLSYLRRYLNDVIS